MKWVLGWVSEGRLGSISHPLTLNLLTNLWFCRSRWTSVYTLDERWVEATEPYGLLDKRINQYSLFMNVVKTPRSWGCPHTLDVHNNSVSSWSHQRTGLVCKGTPVQTNRFGSSGRFCLSFYCVTNCNTRTLNNNLNLWLQTVSWGYGWGDLVSNQRLLF